MYDQKGQVIGEYEEHTTLLSTLNTGLKIIIKNKTSPTPGQNDITMVFDKVEKKKSEREEDTTNHPVKRQIEGWRTDIENKYGVKFDPSDFHTQTHGYSYKYERHDTCLITKLHSFEVKTTKIDGKEKTPDFKFKAKVKEFVCKKPPTFEVIDYAPVKNKQEQRRASNKFMDMIKNQTKEKV